LADPNPERGGTSNPTPLWHWLYLPWVWLVFLPLMLVLTLFWTSAAWFLGHFHADWAYGCAKPWARMLCLSNFTWVRLRGKENIQPGRAYVVMANHSSHFDILAVAARHPVPHRWVMKEELRRVPFLGAACVKAGCVFINRKNRTDAINSLMSESTSALLERGVSLFIFPEGTRSSDGRLQELKKGGFMVALGLGLPILPMTITGSNRILPPHGLHIAPGVITMTVHRAIESGDYGIEKREELMDAVRQAISSGLPGDGQS